MTSSLACLSTAMPLDGQCKHGYLHCYVNLQEKKKTLPFSGTLNHY
jgi:hypothetical protein